MASINLDLLHEDIRRGAMNNALHVLSGRTLSGWELPFQLPFYAVPNGPCIYNEGRLGVEKRLTFKSIVAVIHKTVNFTIC